METIQKFAEDLKARLSESLPECNIDIHDVEKNNSTIYTGLLIREKDNNIAPIIYLNDMFKLYMDGVPESHLIEKIMDIYMECRTDSIPEAECIRDFDAVKDRIFTKLINKDRNIEYLNGKPYRKFQDLALVYHIKVRQNDEINGSIAITNEFIKEWGVNEEQLYSIAMENASKSDKGYICPLEDIIRQIKPDIEIPLSDYSSFQMVFEDTFSMKYCDDKDELLLYIITNSSKYNGASVITYPHVLETIASVLGDFYILPSSTHEILVIEARKEFDKDYLLKTVRDINSTQIAPEEFLSDNIYRYYADEKFLVTVSE